jgi:hypothetical protein
MLINLLEHHSALFEAIISAIINDNIVRIKHALRALSATNWRLNAAVLAHPWWQQCRKMDAVLRDINNIKYALLNSHDIDIGLMFVTSLTYINKEPVIYETCADENSLDGLNVYSHIKKYTNNCTDINRIPLNHMRIYRRKHKIDWIEDFICFNKIKCVSSDIREEIVDVRPKNKCAYINM